MSSNKWYTTLSGKLHNAQTSFSVLSFLITCERGAINLKLLYPSSIEVKHADVSVTTLSIFPVAVIFNSVRVKYLEQRLEVTHLPIESGDLIEWLHSEIL